MLHRSLPLRTLLALCLATGLGLPPLHAAPAPAATPTAAATLPTEAFARLPQTEGVALSPDGRWVAALLHRGDDTLAVVRAVDGDAPAKAVLKNDDRESRLAWLHWVSNERLVINVTYPTRRGNTDTVEARLVVVGRDGSRPVTLVEPSGVAFGSTTQLQDRVVDWLPDDGHHILLQAAVDRRDPSPAVLRVNVDTGAREPVHGRRFGVYQWLTDAQHRVRVGVRQLDTHVEILLRDAAQARTDSDSWRTAWSYEVFDAAAVVPLGFGADPDLLYVSADHNGRNAILEVDLRDPALPRRLLLYFGTRDVGGRLLLDPVTGKAIGVASGVLGDSAASFWDPQAQALARAIDQALPGRFNPLLQLSADGQRYLLYSSGNGMPGQYLAGDRQRSQLNVVGRQYPDLPAAALVGKKRLTITARDGLQLPAFLTLPAGSVMPPTAATAASATTPATSATTTTPARLPTVILAHGGPISRDTLDFDPLSEFLASRGYAVLQVNFRGSAGYGGDYMRAGLQRWGLEMQDDLTDGLQWLVQRGIADPGRVCIVGGSYGGYAALMGAAKTPDLYRCVVSLAGVSDLPALAAWQAHYINGRAMFERMVGSTWDDSQRLRDTSPSRLAAQFKAPVLLLHGTADRQVPFEQSQKMRDALQAAGKPVQLVTLDDGGHQLTVQAHRLQFYRALEDFLAQSLGPR